jgi:site-specific recombinase XerD
LSLNTQAAYLRAVTQRVGFYRRCPERISEREVAAPRFFYHVTLRRPGARFVIPAARQPSKLPHILSREELVRLFSQTRLLRHRALLLTVYATVCA